MTPEQLKLAASLEEEGKAYHEAGHAVLQHNFRMELLNVSIQPIAHSGGRAVARMQHQVELSQMGVFYEDTPERDKFICHLIMVSLAGEVAQKQFCPDSFEQYQIGSDEQHVRSLIKEWDRYATSSDREYKIEELYDHTWELLENPLCVAAIRAVAGSLLEHKQLTGKQAEALIRKAMNMATAKMDGNRWSVVRCPHCEEYVEEF